MEEHDNSWCIADVGFVDVFKIWDDIVCVYIYTVHIYICMDNGYVSKLNDYM